VGLAVKMYQNEWLADLSPPCVDVERQGGLLFSIDHARDYMRVKETGYPDSAAMERSGILGGL
jgi:hypothetical protein